MRRDAKRQGRVPRSRAMALAKRRGANCAVLKAMSIGRARRGEHVTKGPPQRSHNLAERGAERARDQDLERYELSGRKQTLERKDWRRDHVRSRGRTGLACGMSGRIESATPRYQKRHEGELSPRVQVETARSSRLAVRRVKSSSTAIVEKPIAKSTGRQEAMTKTDQRSAAVQEIDREEPERRRRLKGNRKLRAVERRKSRDRARSRARSAETVSRAKAIERN